MKPVFEKVPQRQWESFHCEVIRGSDYGTHWHFHPEHQLTLALKSEGHRIVGDNIAPLRDGDLVLVGSNLPQDQDRMERVCSYIQTHLTEEIERRNLAKIASLSPGAFSRFFGSRMGRPVPEYVSELRIGRACNMLVEDKLNITDIGLDCGFRNLAYFNRRFREIAGTTPREYRRKFARASGG